MNISAFHRTWKKIDIKKLEEAVEHHKNPIIITGVGALACYEIYKDNKHTPKKDRPLHLLRNILILAGCGVGAYYGIKLEKKPAELPINADLKKKIKFAIKHYAFNLSVPFMGIVAGFLSGEIVDRLVPGMSKLNQQESDREKARKKVENHINKSMLNKKNTDTDQNNNGILQYIAKQSQTINQKIDPGNVGKAYGYAGIGLGETLDTVFAAFTGFHVGTQHGFKDRLKRSCFELIVGDIIPVSTAIPICSLINKKLKVKDKTLEFLIKAAILFPIANASTYLGEKVADRFNEKITEKIVDKEFWSEINERETQLLLSLNHSHLDESSKQEITESLRQINEVKQDWSKDRSKVVIKGKIATPNEKQSKQNEQIPDTDNSIQDKNEEISVNKIDSTESPSESDLSVLKDVADGEDLSVAQSSEITQSEKRVAADNLDSTTKTSLETVQTEQPAKEQQKSVEVATSSSPSIENKSDNEGKLNNFFANPAAIQSNYLKFNNLYKLGMK